MNWFRCVADRIIGSVGTLRELGPFQVPRPIGSGLRNRSKHLIIKHFGGVAQLVRAAES